MCAFDFVFRQHIACTFPAASKTHFEILFIKFVSISMHEAEEDIVVGADM